MPCDSKEFTNISLRHAEYYGMQKKFDKLYEESKNGDKFTDLMSIILSQENILLAYRNIKTNTGSKTAGTDKLTIVDVGRFTNEEVIEKVRYILSESPHGYRPKPVRRKEIEKIGGGIRPLGIPCIWDRLIQQSIKQVIEPICEAKFSNNSYGFRPCRSVEHAISSTYRRMQIQNLHYIIEFDIKGFFDNVNHAKLIRQIWSMGIRDKQLIFIIKRILKAPIKMPSGELIYPEKGTPQGGIISPLLANIVLNELDKWVESQWENNPVIGKYKTTTNEKGVINKNHGYRAMRNTKLKEMYITRYADDFRIFCRTRKEAEKIKIAVMNWLKERLKLEVSPEKTRVVNIRRQYTNFLGFKIKVRAKGKKQVVKSHIADKNLKNEKKKLKKQAKRIIRPRGTHGEYKEVALYNALVTGIQNYYQIATHVSADCHKLQKSVIEILNVNKCKERLRRKGRKLTEAESKRYEGYKMLRYISGVNEPIYPVGIVQHKNPIAIRCGTCYYTEEGRKNIHKNLTMDLSMMLKLVGRAVKGKSIEYNDNRISLFVAQKGRCAVTGIAFGNTAEIHCHHIIPRNKNGDDKYKNLILLNEQVHKLIHAVREETIQKYLIILKLSKEQLNKVNELRENIGLIKINQ